MMTEVPFPTIRLARRPGADKPVTLDCFETASADATPLLGGRFRLLLDEASGAFSTDPPLPPGCIVVETTHLSVDPYMRCRFNEASGVAYAVSFEVGAPIVSAGVGVVRVSTAVGTHPVGTWCGGDTFDWHWQRFNFFGPANADSVAAALPLPIPSAIAASLGPSVMLGALGITGVTAYFGVMREAALQRGDVFVVSGAAGGTGIIACQLAKQICGARVIAICGSDEKCSMLLQEGFADVAINYKSRPAAAAATTAATGYITQQINEATAVFGHEEGATAYFDNVGGRVSDEVIAALAPNSRVVLCGQIATYNSDVPYPPPIPSETQQLLETRKIKRDRYLVLKYSDEFPAAVAALAEAILGGKIVAKETVERGLENAPAAFIGVMGGSNVGKMVVQL